MKGIIFFSNLQFKNVKIQLNEKFNETEYIMTWIKDKQGYERKIIHSKLQGNTRVETTSVGEEPHRRIIVSLKK